MKTLRNYYLRRFRFYRFYRSCQLQRLLIQRDVHFALSSFVYTRTRAEHLSPVKSLSTTRQNLQTNSKNALNPHSKNATELKASRGQGVRKRRSSSSFLTEHETGQEISQTRASGDYSKSPAKTRGTYSTRVSGEEFFEALRNLQNDQTRCHFSVCDSTDFKKGRAVLDLTELLEKFLFGRNRCTSNRFNHVEELQMVCVLI